MRDRLARLPTSPGVYRFGDADDRVLYIGRATSLRGRVGPTGPTCASETTWRRWWPGSSASGPWSQIRYTRPPGWSATCSRPRCRPGTGLLAARRPWSISGWTSGPRRPGSRSSTSSCPATTRATSARTSAACGRGRQQVPWAGSFRSPRPAPGCAAPSWTSRGCAADPAPTGGFSPVGSPPCSSASPRPSLRPAPRWSSSATRRPGR